MVSLAKALRISEGVFSFPSTITGAVVSVFVAGNDTSHADHLKAMNVRVKQVSVTYDSLAPLSSTLHSEITKMWYISQLLSSCLIVSDASFPSRNTMYHIRRMKIE
jgi:hypothetical protein